MRADWRWSDETYGGGLSDLPHSGLENGRNISAPQQDLAATLIEKFP